MSKIALFALQLQPVLHALLVTIYQAPHVPNVAFNVKHARPRQLHVSAAISDITSILTLAQYVVLTAHHV